MSDAKTKPTDVSVDDFLSGVEPEWKRADAEKLLEIMKKITGEEALMWGPSIVGFGKYHYVYDSGREGDWMLAGFSPRKSSLTVYIIGGFGNQEDLLTNLGKFKKSVGCLYIKRLTDIDLTILEKIIERSIETVKKRYAKYN